MEIRVSCWREAKKIFLFAILSFLIVPFILLICKIMEVKRDVWVFSEDKIVHSYGLFSKNEEVLYIKDITDCQMNKSLNGRIWNYGDLRFTVIGQKSRRIPYAKHPEDAQAMFRQAIEKFSKKSVTEVVNTL